jgi:hypothetical protein
MMLMMSVHLAVPCSWCRGQPLQHLAKDAGGALELFQPVWGARMIMPLTTEG